MRASVLTGTLFLIATVASVPAKADPTPVIDTYDWSTAGLPGSPPDLIDWSWTANPSSGFNDSTDLGLQSETNLNGSYATGDEARWTVAPLGDSYIERVDFTGLSHVPGAIPACTKIGIYDIAANVWEPGKSLDPSDNTTVDAPEKLCGDAVHEERQVRVGNSATPDGPGGDAEGSEDSAGRFALTVDRDGVHAGRASNLLRGANVYRYDESDPEFLSPTPASTDWADDANAIHPLSPEASDDGLGVKSLKLEGRSIDTDATPNEILRTHSCTGPHTSRCPASWSTTAPSWAQSLAYTLPEGEVPLTLTANDIVGNEATQAWTRKIDRSQPDITLTGGLAPTATGGASERFKLHVQSTDGDASSVATRRSGVESVEIAIDGSTVASTSEDCSAPEGSCALSLDHEVDRTDYSGKTVQIAVTAIDGLGHTRTQSYQKTVYGGTALPSTISSNMILTKDDSPYVGSNVTIASGATVTAQPGASVKLSGALTVNGTLDVQGSSAEPVRFTSSQNTAAGQWSGITLNSGTSVIDRANVRYATTGIAISGGFSPQVKNSTVRNSSSRGISITGGGAPEIASNTVTDNASEGIYYNASSSANVGQIKIHDNVVERNGGQAGIYVSAHSSANVDGITFEGNEVDDNTALGVLYSAGVDEPLPPDIDENALSGNGSNAIWLNGRVEQSTSWESRGYPLVFSNDVRIVSGATLSIGPGLVVKGTSSTRYLYADGRLDVAGTVADPVVFTSINDDIAGDTDRDGAATPPAPGNWGGIQLAASSANSALANAEIRYAVTGLTITGAPGVTVSGSEIRKSQTGVSTATASPTLASLDVIENSGDGIKILSGGPEIANSTLSDNGDEGVEFVAGSGKSGAVRMHDNVVKQNGGTGISIAVSYASVQGETLSENVVRDNGDIGIAYTSNSNGSIPLDIDENTLVGNARNAIWLSGEVEGDASWEPRGFPLVVTSREISVASGASLTLAPGLVIKGEASTTYGDFFQVWGELEAIGTASDPITFTSLKDDSIGGDTNGDGGATQPGPDDWRGVYVLSSSIGAVFDRVDVRYAEIGIRSEGSAPVSIANSEFTDNEQEAVSVGRGAVAITDNEMTDNGGGLEVYGGGNPEIARNLISGNAGRGILYDAPVDETTGEIRIHDNSVDQNGSGISVDLGEDPNVDGVTLAGNSVTDNATTAVSYSADTTWDPVLPQDVDENTIAGNGSDTLWVNGTVAENTTWEDHGYTYAVGARSVRVASGATLTLGAGAVVKGGYGGTYVGGIDVQGTLNAQGSQAAPVTMTSIYDDSIGGDTGQDGAATSPAPSDWSGITFYGSGTGQVDRAHLTYARDAAYVSCPCPNPPTITRSKFLRNTDGIEVGGDPPAGASIATRSTFSGNTSYAINKRFGNVATFPYNYFGSTSGPRPMGTGDLIGSKVNPSPLGEDDANPCQGQDHQCGTGADPVALASGAFTYAHTDLHLTSKGGPLTFARSYNSSDGSDAGLGPGWSHSGLLRAAEDENGDVVVRRADGRADLFAKTQSGYDPPSGVHDELTKLANGTFNLTTLDRTRYEFDATSRIDRIVDDHGLVTDYAYDANGRLASITDASSQTLTFSYNASNHITAVSDSTGRTVSFTYDSAGNLATVTDPLNGVTEYGYDAEHRLISITDPRDVTFLENTYDSQGRVTAQRDGLNNLWDLDYGSSQTTVTEPEGGEKTYAFDSLGRVSSETDQLGHTTSYGYDARGNVDQMTRPGGAVTTRDYDAAGNLVSESDPEGGQSTYTYDTQNRLTSVTDPRNKTWSFTWSAANDLTAIEDPDDEITTLDYNAAGQPTQITDPEDHSKTLTYDARGNVTAATDGENETTTLGYNTRNYLTAVTEPGKAAATFTYNALGDRLSATTPEGNTTSYEYDASGGLTKIIDPALKEWVIERNAMERPTTVIDPLLNQTQISYDGNLNPISVTDRRSNITTYDYDLANRLTEIDRPASGPMTFEYDGRGNRTKMIDGRSNASTYSYDLADRLTQVTEPLSTTTSYDYDAAGNLTQIVDPRSNTTGFAYDDLGRLTQVSQPLSKQTTYTYDGAGRMASKSTGVDTITFAYDAANRPIQVSSASNTLRAFAYDDAGRITAATDAENRQMQLAWDDDDRLISINDGRGQTMSSTYDSRGNLTSQTDARGTIAYGYDDLSRMTSVTDPQLQQSTFAYNAEDGLTSATLPNGIVTTNTYDADGRMSGTESVSGSTTLQSFDYGYDANGNRTAVTDRLNDTTTYSYDALNRLTEFDTSVDPVVSYGYDAAGNRTSAGSRTFSYNALNQLTSDSTGTSYDYDSAGRLESDTNGSDTTSYSWDPLDQLLEVDDGSNPVAFDYDALGRRADRTESSTTRSAHYGDLTDRPIFDAGMSGSTVTEWVQGPIGLLEESDSATSYVLADAHGDVTTMTDDAGSVASRQEFDPWGDQQSGPGLDFGWLGSQQRRSDTETGMIQMGVRSYAPTIARFMSEDPVLAHLGIGQSTNRHSYTWGNPVNHFDLDGRDVCVLGACASDVGDVVSDGADMVSSAYDYWTGSPSLSDYGDLDEMATEAVDYWANSDSPAADVMGPLATLGDMALNPSRVDDYFKGCNAAQIVAGGALTAATVPLAAGAVHHGVIAAGASSVGNLATTFGAGTAALGEAGMSGTALLFGPEILSEAC